MRCWATRRENAPVVDARGWFRPEFEVEGGDAAEIVTLCAQRSGGSLPASPTKGARSDP